MRKFVFRFLAATALFLLSGASKAHGQQISQSIRLVSIGGVPIAQLYTDPEFWRDDSLSHQPSEFEQKAMKLIDEFEYNHYDLFLSWLGGNSTDSRVRTLEEQLASLYYQSMENVSASVEGDPLLQKQNVQDSILKH